MDDDAGEASPPPVPAHAAAAGAPSSRDMAASPTRSRSVTEMVNGSHRFKIQGYSLTKGMGLGKHIASKNFTVGGYQWAIYFYPDGKNPEDNSAYVSIFIAFASEGTDVLLQDQSSEGKHKVHSLFELMLQDQSSEGKHKVHSHFDRSLESGTYTLKYRGSIFDLSYLRWSPCSQTEGQAAHEAVMEVPLGGPGGVPHGVSGWKAKFGEGVIIGNLDTGRTNVAKNRSRNHHLTAAHCWLHERRLCPMPWRVA